MRLIFKVSYYIRTNYENKEGKSPLMIRIYLNGKNAHCRISRNQR